MPHTKERLTLMFTIIHKMLTQSGLKSVSNGLYSVSQEEYASGAVGKLPEQWELTMPAYVLKDASNSKNGLTGQEKCLKDILVTLWRNDVSRLGRLDIESVWKIRHLLAAGGPNWFTSILVDELLGAVYQLDLEKMTDLLVAVFHVDIEQCTLGKMINLNK